MNIVPISKLQFVLVSLGIQNQEMTDKDREWRQSITNGIGLLYFNVINANELIIILA